MMAVTGPCSSIGSPMTLRMRPRVSGPTGTRDRRAGVDDLGAAYHAVGAVHRDAPNRPLTQFLGDFQHQGAVIDLATKRILNERAVHRGTARPPRLPVTPG